MKKTIIDFR